jgi:hypothetical protein
MEVLEPSKRRLRVGDIFAFRVRGHPYRFGRVIRTDAKAGPFDKLVLIYLYAPTSPERDKIPELRVDNLLVPPLLTNRLPWSRGYFVAVDNRQLSDADVLAVHCFEDSRGNLYDEMSNEIDHRVEPMGEFGVQSFRTIDDLISDAVGVPRVPDE